VAWRGETPNKLRMLMASVLGFGGTLFLFALSPWFILALPLVLISDIFASTFNTVNNTIIQVLIPDAVRGRVNSLLMMTFGLTPLGTLPVSAAAQAWGAPVAVAGASLMTVVISVLFYFGSKALRGIDDVHHAAMLEGARSEPVFAPATAPVAVTEPAGAGG
jgi:MFS family permease